MYFRHSDAVWRDYPALVAGVLAMDGVTPDASVEARADRCTAIAESRLAERPEGELPEIQAWRRVFSSMGLKPTQYRCAAEALLRRLRRDGALPQIHPLIDLCNAVSAAFATPVAAFDTARIEGHLEVRHATGGELYESFAGEIDHPEPGEVIYADRAGNAHARRWTNRQSGTSAIRDETTSVLIVAEAMHDSATTDIPRLVAELAQELGAAWSANVHSAVLTRSSPRFEF